MILPRHRRVVLWGLADQTGDSFQHIWRHYAHALDRLEKPWLWVPDEARQRDGLGKGDLVFAVDVAANHLGHPVAGVDYLLHNVGDDHPVRDGLDPDRCVYLQVWTSDCAERGEAWGPVRRFDRHSRVLYQPWGTDLLPGEFELPVFNPRSREVPFVGSVWDDNGMGNVGAITELGRVCSSHRLRFAHHHGVDDAENRTLIRRGRFAPAFTGAWQVDHNYLPCRVFKNVSYGALGVTNVTKFSDLFGSAAVVGESIAETVSSVLSLSEDDYVDLVWAQQKVVSDDYTYVSSLSAIERAWEELR